MVPELIFDSKRGFCGLNSMIQVQNGKLLMCGL